MDINELKERAINTGTKMKQQFDVKMWELKCKGRQVVDWSVKHPTEAATIVTTGVAVFVKARGIVKDHQHDKELWTRKGYYIHCRKKPTERQKEEFYWRISKDGGHEDPRSVLRDMGLLRK